MMDYRVDILDAHTHRYSVRLRIPRPDACTRVSLPVWIPGSYLVREFARHLSPIHASQGARALQVKALDKSTWEIECSGSSSLTLSYEVYAFDSSVRGAFLNAQRGFFNGTSLFLSVQGRTHEPHTVWLGRHPRGWRVATALPAVDVDAQGWGRYEAADYDSLIDHPVTLGEFWHGEFTLRGARHEFVITGAPPNMDGERLLNETQRICEQQMQFWHGRGRPPFEHYVFMLQATADDYGGLEHRQSTALVCARGDLPIIGQESAGEGHQALLGLISHEYFHTWNVKRLKPQAFDKLDLSREAHTSLLWFFEGLTSYYDDRFVLQAGLIDVNAYLKLLAKAINHVLNTPGRHDYSVSQASFDAWTRYYRPDENTANATVSYYTKGALVGLLMDLSLRLLPANGAQTPSLDGVMRRLWKRPHAICEDDIAQALHDEAGVNADHPQLKALGLHARDWRQWLWRWTQTCEELPLVSVLQAHGIEVVTKSLPSVQLMGMALRDDQGLRVKAVMRHSIAERMGVSAGDECLALDDWRLLRIKDLNAALSGRGAQRSHRLLICRDQRLLELTLPPLEATLATLAPGSAQQSWSLQCVHQPDDAQTAKRQADWLQRGKTTRRTLLRGKA